MSQDRMKPEKMIKVLRHCAESERFRWIIGRYHLSESAAMLESLLAENRELRLQNELMAGLLSTEDQRLEQARRAYNALRENADELYGEVIQLRSELAEAKVEHE